MRNKKETDKEIKNNDKIEITKDEVKVENEKEAIENKVKAENNTNKKTSGNKKNKKSTKKEIINDEEIDEEVIQEEKEITEEKLEKIKDELKTSKKKSKNTSKNKKVKKDILRNILIAIIITIYFVFVGLGIKTIPVTEYLLDLKTFSIFTVIIAVFIFEKAYKKDEGYLAIHGIEMIIVGIETLFILNLYSLENKNFNYALYGIMLLMILYYFVKSLIIFIKSKLKKSK